MTSRPARSQPMEREGAIPAPRAARGRAAKQERSERTRRALVQAVVALLAEQGMAGLTHRLVARRSGASLAATTYYFDTKHDMIAAASEQLLRDFLGQFGDIATAAHGRGPAAFRAFVADLLARSIDEGRTGSLAWCEIMLGDARRPDARASVRAWFARIGEVWRAAAERFDLPDPDGAARSAMDVTLGALFHGLALGLTAEQMAASLTGAVDAEALFAGAGPPPPTGASQTPLGARAAATRARILEAAIALLAREGASGVNYRTVALEAGLTPGAPAYHFASSDEMLTEAQALLFARSQARFREVMESAFRNLDLSALVELTAVVFQSEATVHADLNLATFALWLQAARDPGFRPLAREAITDLSRNWRRALLWLGSPMRGAEPLLVEYLFVGALLRMLACGVTTGDLVDVRRQLKRELTAMAEGRHWLQGRSEPAGRLGR